MQARSALNRFGWLLAIGAFWSCAFTWRTVTNSGAITSLAEGGGAYWAAGSGGVLHFDPGTGDIEKITNTEGLADNDILSSAYGDGYFWFGSSTGHLSRLDPTSSQWRQFAFMDRDGSALRLNHLYSDGARLWVSSNIGLSLFDIERHGGEIRETYRRFGDIPPGTEVRGAIVRGDSVWVATGSGLACASTNDPNLLDYTHWSSFTRTDLPALPTDNLQGLLSFGGNLWVRSSRHLMEVVVADGAVAVGTVVELPRTVYCLSVSSDTLYLGAEAGKVYTWSGEKLDSADTQGVDSAVTAILLPSGTGAILGTRGQGLFVRQGAEWLNLSLSEPAQNYVADIEQTADGAIWLAHPSPDLSAFSDAVWSRVRLPSSNQLSLESDAAGNLWTGTFGRGVFRITPDHQISRYDRNNSSLIGNSDSNGLNFIVVYDMQLDTSGVLWFACYRGTPSRPISFCRPEIEQWDYYPSTTDTFPEKVVTIYSDGSTVWTGYEGSGVVAVDYQGDPFSHSGLEVRHYTRLSLLPSDNVRVLRADRNGRLYVGTDVGVAYYDPGIDRFVRVLLPEGIGPQVNCLEFDVRNNLWVGTANGLAFAAAGETEMLPFTTDNSGLISDQVNALLFDRSRTLWVCTDRGISLLDYDIGAVTDDVKQVFAYPNPLIVTDAGERTYFNYIDELEVRIYTLDGNLVNQVTTNGGWDGTNEAGEKVASGLYIFYIRDQQGNSLTGKVALIRK